MPHQGATEKFYCEPCDITSVFRGNEQDGHREDEVVRCTECAAALGFLRCDVFPAALVVQWSGNHPGRMVGE